MEEPVRTAPELEHPVVTTIRQVAFLGERERFEIDAAGMERIESTLLAFAEHPTLPDAIVGTFAMISGFYYDAQSPSAAITLVKILAECRPKLTGLTATQRDRLQASVAEFMGLSGQEAHRAPALDAKDPDGTVKAKRFTNPGMQVPPGARRTQRTPPARRTDGDDPTD